MPTEQKQVTIAANTTNENVLSDRFKFAQELGLLNIGIKSEAVGLLVSFIVNGQIIADGLWPSIDAGPDVPPVIPDDYLVTDEAVAPGDIVQLKIQNTTGAGITCIYSVNLTPA